MIWAISRLPQAFAYKAQGKARGKHKAPYFVPDDFTGPMKKA